MGFKKLLMVFLFMVAGRSAMAAPFYPSFHNLDASTFFANSSYYPNQGLGLQTFTLYRVANHLMVAGSYDNKVANPWYAQANLTADGFNASFAALTAQGLRPRELAVMIDSVGQPKFSSIWKKRSGESFYTWINMNDADLDAKWNDLVNNQHYRIEDYVAYSVGGQRKHAAIFVKDGQPFYFFHGLTEQGMSAKIAELQGQGFFPVSINGATTPQGVQYSAVWLRSSGQSAVYFNMSADGYQNRFNQYSAQGFRVTKLQVYNNGSRFAAIWKK